MKYNSNIHHRRSIRLKGYDYSRAGAYFVTICAHERQCLFGEIVDGEMRPNEYGRIVAAEWIRSGELRMEIELGEYAVMPNHFHGVVMIRDIAHGGNICRGDRPVAPTTPGPQQKSIGAMMAGFKSAVTKRVNIIRDTHGAPVWQRNYYEHVIRDDADYTRIVEYVADNPGRWEEDSLHPENFRIVTNTVNGKGATVGATGRSPQNRVANRKGENHSINHGGCHSENRGECHSPLRTPHTGGCHE